MKKTLLSLAAIFMATSALVAQTPSIATLYNEAADAYQKKDFAAAAAKFEQVIDDGMDDDSAASLVTTARSYLPKCYYMMGGRAMQAKNYESALKNFTTAAEYAELYDDIGTMNNANSWIGKLYQQQGGEAFNAKNYATAAEVFAKGYAADPRNTDMAQWLGICYAETARFDEAMKIFSNLVAMGANPRYAEAAAEAQKNIELYTNNKLAGMQSAKDYNGIIAFAEGLLEQNPMNALAAKIRLQAYSDKKDYASVDKVAQEAADMQTSDAEASNIYFIWAAAYNAREMRDQAIATFKKVTSGANAAAAKAAVAELTK